MVKQGVLTFSTRLEFAWWPDLLEKEKPILEGFHFGHCRTLQYLPKCKSQPKTCMISRSVGYRALVGREKRESVPFSATLMERNAVSTLVKVCYAYCGQKYTGLLAAVRFPEISTALTSVVDSSCSRADFLCKLNSTNVTSNLCTHLCGSSGQRKEVRKGAKEFCTR